MNCICCFRYLIVTKCEGVSPALESEYKAEVKAEVTCSRIESKDEGNIKMEAKRVESGIMLKPKEEIVTKSAHQIVHEQSGK